MLPPPSRSAPGARRRHATSQQYSPLTSSRHSPNLEYYVNYRQHSDGTGLDRVDLTTTRLGEFQVTGHSFHCSYSYTTSFTWQTGRKMPRPQTIALSLPAPLPSLPVTPHPSASPLQKAIEHTTSTTDYDAVCVPLTNSKWQERWERLCLRPIDEEDSTPQEAAEREKVDREADVWRREGGLNRDELVVSRLEETGALIAMASDWLELDSPDEGIRFDSEIVS